MRDVAISGENEYPEDRASDESKEIERLSASVEELEAENDSFRRDNANLITTSNLYHENGVRSAAESDQRGVALTRCVEALREIDVMPWGELSEDEVIDTLYGWLPTGHAALALAEPLVTEDK